MPRPGGAPREESVAPNGGEASRARRSAAGVASPDGAARFSRAASPGRSGTTRRAPASPTGTRPTRACGSRPSRAASRRSGRPRRTRSAGSPRSPRATAPRWRARSTRCRARGSVLRVLEGDGATGGVGRAREALPRILDQRFHRLVRARLRADAHHLDARDALALVRSGGSTPRGTAVRCARRQRAGAVLRTAGLLDERADGAHLEERRGGPSPRRPSAGVEGARGGFSRSNQSRMRSPLVPYTSLR
jgi:hypothetical protein